MTRIEAVMANETAIMDTIGKLWRDGLRVMNEAVAMTAEKGPAVAVEYIADFLNNTDGIDVEMAQSCPADWLTRWTVERAPQPHRDPCDDPMCCGVEIDGEWITLAESRRRRRGPC